MLEKEEIESLVKEIKGLLNEVLKEQINLRKDVELKHIVTMKKLDKINEYNKISDMTNQVFERRIANIEEKVGKLVKSKQ